MFNSICIGIALSICQRMHRSIYIINIAKILFLICLLLIKKYLHKFQTICLQESLRRKKLDFLKIGIVRSSIYALDLFVQKLQRLCYKHRLNRRN